jgi:hypothetical protein
VARAEALVASEDVGAARKELGSLEKRLAELFQAGAGDAQLQQRFSAAREALRARTAEARAERTEREARNKARLEELCQALEALAQAPQLMLKEADARLRASKEALAEPGPLPRADREALLERLKAARAAVFPRFQEAREDADWRRFAAEGVRESLLARLQALQGETNRDKLDRELRDVDRLWRQAGPPKDPNEPQIASFTALRNELRSRADEALRQRAAEFEANAARKVALCEQAEALRDSSDWKNTADALQKLQAEWKTVGAVPREQAQALWQRFRAACDSFFTRRKADLDGRKQVWTVNLQKKQALIERVEALKASEQWDKAVAEVKRLQAEWREAGPVKPSQSEQVWKRFRGACDEFFARYKQRDELAQQAAVAERESPVAELEALLERARGRPRGPGGACAGLRDALPPGQAAAARVRRRPRGAPGQGQERPGGGLAGGFCRHRPRPRVQPEGPRPDVREGRGLAGAGRGPARAFGGVPGRAAQAGPGPERPGRRRGPRRAAAAGGRGAAHAARTLAAARARARAGRRGPRSPLRGRGPSPRSSLEAQPLRSGCVA